jgi:hypothetical protein
VSLADEPSFLSRRDTPQTIIDVFKTLSELPRFSMCVMFMSKADKAAISDIFTRLSSQVGDVDKAELARLQKLFGV